MEHLRPSRSQLFNDCFRLQSILLGWSYRETLLALVPGLRLHRLRATLRRITRAARSIDDHFLNRLTTGEVQYLAAVIHRTANATEWFLMLQFPGRADWQMRRVAGDIYRLREALAALKDDKARRAPAPVEGWEPSMPRPLGDAAFGRL